LSQQLQAQSATVHGHPSPDGWLRTDDLARQDDDGYLCIIKRNNNPSRLVFRG
jgi:long-subunit acyl-CoA synthetase (AMP-forming)